MKICYKLQTSEEIQERKTEYQNIFTMEIFNIYSYIISTFNNDYLFWQAYPILRLLSYILSRNSLNSQETFIYKQKKIT